MLNSFARHRFLPVSILVSMLFQHTHAQISHVNHWEGIALSTQDWKYFPGTENPPTGWNNTGFADSSWNTGMGSIGYDDGDDSTIIDPVVTLYMRKVFTIFDTADIASLVLFMDYDDGFVAYLNGTEFARSNLTPANPVYSDTTDFIYEARGYRNLLPEEFRVPVSWLNWIIKPGENVLAVEVHNNNSASFDMTAVPDLFAGIKSDSSNYYPVPAWFEAPVNYEICELPIISINTLGNQVNIESRVKARMGIIDNGPGMPNNLTDPFNHFLGDIGIKYRGSSSFLIPKKNYSLETWDSLQNNLNVSLLGLPEENDWILYGPYSDKSLIRNVLTYKISNDMGRYASRTRFCELFIDWDYKGLYILMEKIKQDKNRVDIAKLNPEDISGDQLTGGYIIRVDKTDSIDYPPWISVPDPGLPGEENIEFQYDDPNGADLALEQQDYIRDFIFRFASILSGDSYAHPVNGYYSFIDLPSFVDFVIMNEFSKNVDSYKFSTYMYKDRDSSGGKLKMGPVWDYDLAFGNVDYLENSMVIPGWMYTEGFRMYWFRRMMNDERFANLFGCRYHELRNEIISDVYLTSYIDSLANLLQNPVYKNFRQWPILGEYIWPNQFVFDTWQEEIDFLKQWLIGRLEWMDQNTPGQCVTALAHDPEMAAGILIFPNPVDDQFCLRVDQPVNFKNLMIFDSTGRLKAVLASPGSAEFCIKWSEMNLGGPGLYFLSIQKKDGTIYRSKILKR